MAEIAAPQAAAPSESTPQNTPADSSPKSNPDSNPDPQADVEPWRKVKHKYKAAGEIVEVDYDELVRRAQLADGADKRLFEATKKEREILSRLDSLKNAKSFDEVVDLLGGDERALGLAEEYVWNKIQYEKLSPAEKEALKAKKEAESAKKELADLKALEESKTKAERDRAASEIINREISDAIAEAEKAGLSPADVPEYVERVIENMILHLEYLEQCEEEGIAPTKSPLSPRDVLRRLKDRDSKKTHESLKKLSAKELKELLSKEQLEELRKAEIEGLYSSTPARQSARATREKTPEKAVDPFEENSPSQSMRKKPSTKDWFGAMEKRYEGR